MPHTEQNAEILTIVLLFLTLFVSGTETAWAGCLHIKLILWLYLTAIRDVFHDLTYLL